MKILETYIKKLIIESIRYDEFSKILHYVMRREGYEYKVLDKSESEWDDESELFYTVFYKIINKYGQNFVIRAQFSTRDRHSSIIEDFAISMRLFKVVQEPQTFIQKMLSKPIKTKDIPIKSYVKIELPVEFDSWKKNREMGIYNKRPVQTRDKFIKGQIIQMTKSAVKGKEKKFEKLMKHSANK